MAASIKIPEALLEQISKECNLPVYIVDRIIRHQFKFVRDNMASGEMRAIRLHNLGVFVPKEMINNAKRDRIPSDKRSVQGGGG